VTDSLVRNSIIGEHAQVTSTLLDNSIVGNASILVGRYNRFNVGDSSQIEFS
jgi:glucose-1-phosphate thymidylyltransferase